MSRRGVLAGAGLGGLAAATGSSTALAAIGWRLMPEKVTAPLVPPPATPVPVGYLGSAVRVAGDPVPHHDLHGQRVVHITQLGNLLTAHADSWRTDHDPGHLTFCASVLDALAQRAVARQGALFLSYEFSWHTSNGELTSPWHSAFGQAKFPRVLDTMYRATGQRRWLQLRDQLVAAFRLPPVASRPDLPWIAGVDANHCLWLEEYPYPGGQLSAVFNGHFYALHELATYLRQSGDTQARDLVSGAAGTLDFYRNVCRAPGRYSNYYASSTRAVPSYHAINTSCYQHLYDYTGADRIGLVVDEMARDWPLTLGPLVSGQRTAWLSGASVRVAAQGPGGHPAAPSTWTPGRPMQVSLDGRYRWPGVAGTWLRMTSGPKRRLLVQEAPGAAFVTGDQVDRIDFTRPRSLWLDGRVRHVGQRLDARGLPVAATTRSLHAPSTAHSTARARIAGRHHLLVADGVFAGQWLPESSSVAYR